MRTGVVSRQWLVESWIGGRELTSWLVFDSLSLECCSRRFTILSMSLLAYSNILPCSLKMSTLTSHLHRIDSSIAFLSRPCFRFMKVTCRFRSSRMGSMMIFFLPMSGILTEVDGGAQPRLRPHKWSGSPPLGSSQISARSAPAWCSVWRSALRHDDRRRVAHSLYAPSAA